MIINRHILITDKWVGLRGIARPGNQGKAQELETFGRRSVCAWRERKRGRDRRKGAPERERGTRCWGSRGAIPQSGCRSRILSSIRCRDDWWTREPCSRDHREPFAVPRHRFPALSVHRKCLDRQLHRFRWVRTYLRSIIFGLTVATVETSTVIC